MIQKYTQDWPVHRPRSTAVPGHESSSNEVILLTGSTGGLGSQILAQLVAMPSVSRVYAFNRPSQKSLYDRHLESFVDRGNDISLLQSDKIVYVEGDTSVVGFNIKSELYNEVCNRLLYVKHS
jgi:thioester reductase-like protein